MSDMQAKIAARRALLVQQEADRQIQEHVVEKQLQIAEREQADAALDGIAADLSTGGTNIRRDGDGLTIDDSTRLEADASGLNNAQINALFKREVRKRWTTLENWIVIGLIVYGAGRLYLPFYGFNFDLAGIGIVIVGFTVGRFVREKHKKAVIEEYPTVFGNIPISE